MAERHIQAFLEAMTHLGYGREEILTLLRQEDQGRRKQWQFWNVKI
ncbi:MAG: hypothetical protein ACLTYN_09955 [Dysosmobacter welbionis]